MEEAIDLLTGEAEEGHEWTEPGYYLSTRYRGDGLWPRNVAFADGSVASMGLLPDRETARAYLTRAGGEEIQDAREWNDDRTKPFIGYIIHWQRIIANVMFVVLVVLPLVRKKFSPPAGEA